MEKDLYSVYDRVTNVYGEPFVAVNKEDCFRRCAFSFRSNPYAKDLMLYCVGSFNPDTGSVGPCVTPVFVCNIIDLISPVPSEVTPNEQ